MAEALKVDEDDEFFERFGGDPRLELSDVVADADGFVCGFDLFSPVLGGVAVAYAGLCD